MLPMFKFSKTNRYNEKKNTIFLILLHHPKTNLLREKIIAFLIKDWPYDLTATWEGIGQFGLVSILTLLGPDGVLASLAVMSISILLKEKHRQCVKLLTSLFSFKLTAYTEY